MDSNLFAADETWGTEALLPSSLEILKSFDNDLNKSIEIDAIFKRLIEESLELERREELERKFADLELDFLNDFSSEEDAPPEPEKLVNAPENVASRISKTNESSLNTEEKLVQVNNASTEVHLVVSLDSVAIKSRVTDALACIKSNSDRTVFVNVLSNLLEADIDSILSKVLYALPDDQIITFFKYIKDIEYDSGKVWRVFFFQWFFDHSNTTFALDTFKNIFPMFENGCAEGFVLPSIKRLKEDSDAQSEIIKNIIEFLPPDKRTLTLRLLCASLAKEFVMAQFDLLPNFIELAEFDSDLMDTVLCLLESKILEMKNHRQMGLAILALVPKISTESLSFAKFSEISSKFVGTMRFRIAQALKRKSQRQE